MRSATYQGQVGPLLDDVASHEPDEETVMDSSPQVGQELREAVARVLRVDPESLRPRQG